MFDVIILDLNMPIIDGYEACKKIRALYNVCNLMKEERDPIQLKKSKEGDLN